jgi:LysM repeat protein
MRLNDLFENDGTDWMDHMRALAHKMAPQDKLKQAHAQRQGKEKSERKARVEQDRARLPELQAEYQAMKDEYAQLGGGSYQYADSEQNLSDQERRARDMELSLKRLANRIHDARENNSLEEFAMDNNGYSGATTSPVTSGTAVSQNLPSMNTAKNIDSPQTAVVQPSLDPTIKNVFQTAQDANQQRLDRRSDMAATSPADAAQMKKDYQRSIVNPEFLNDLPDTKTDIAPPAPATKPQPDTMVKQTPSTKPAVASAKSGSWQELHQLNKDTIANPNRIFPGQKIKITPFGDEYIVKKGDTLSGIASAMRNTGMPPSAVKENATPGDLYQILRNAGLKNTP